MKKNILILGLLILPNLWANGQSIDSLEKVLLTMPDDTNKVMQYRQIYRAYYYIDQTGPMLEVAEKGLVLSRKLQFEKGIDLFIYYKASALDMLGRGRESIPYFEEGLQMAERKGDLAGAAGYHVNIGAAFQGIGDLDKGLQHYLAGYGIYKTIGDLKNLSKLLNNIGVIYRTQNKHDRAEEIYQQSLEIKETLHDSLGMAASYQNLALLYSYGRINRENESIEHLKTALAIYQKLNRYDDVAGCQSNLGQIYYNFQRYAEAKTVLNEAQKRFDIKPSVDNGATNYHLLGKLAAMENNPVEAEHFFHKGLAIARKMGQGERIFPLLTDLAQTQKILGNTAGAYLTLKEAMALKDSVTEGKRLALMEEMQVRFDVTQKDNLIKISQLELEQRTRQRNWLVTVVLFLAILTGVIFFGLRHRIRFNKMIAAQQAAIQSQTIRQLEQDNKLTTLTAMIEGQEQERSRIANDLHDGLGGLLASVKSHFNALEKPETGKDLFHKTNTLIDNACGEVRRIAHNMMPRALALSGLRGALEDLAIDLQKQGIHCDLEMEDILLSPTQSVTTYRIIQELSTNVVKHAGADHLLIQLLHRGRQVTIIVEDNGQGFNIQQALQKKGLGLSSIESRVQFLHGTVEWDAVEGAGTTVIVSYEL